MRGIRDLNIHLKKNHIRNILARIFYFLPFAVIVITLITS